MGILRRLREWREDKNGTLIGPDIEADSVDAGSVNTGKLDGTGRPYSVEDDFNDVSIYKQQKSPTTQTDYTLLDISDGPKVLESFVGVGDQFNEPGGTNNPGSVEYTIDGTTSTFPNTSFFGQDRDGTPISFGAHPSVRYDSSLKIRWGHSGTGNTVTVIAYIYGSGPHSAAIVSDGKEPYQTADNLSDEQIAGMTAPDGYRVVKNPQTADGVDDVWSSVWDNTKEMFVED